MDKKEYLTVEFNVNKYIEKYEDTIFYRKQYLMQQKYENSPKVLFKSDARLLYPESHPEEIFDEISFNLEYPDGKEFAVILTHDIDYIYPSWKYRYFISAIEFLKFDFLKAFRIFTKRYNPYFSFKKILNIESKFNARSTFFIIADPDHDGYKISEERDLIRFLNRNNLEVGLHGGFYSYNNLDKIKREKRILEKAIGREVVGYRNHYLRFKLPHTWRILERLGFKYDSTFGWNDRIGYRLNVPYAFHPFDIEENRIINILEIPLVIMDVTLFGYLKLTFFQAFERIKKLVKKVKEKRGVIVVNWHNDKFDGLYFKGWDKFYENMLKLFYEEKAWFVDGITYYNFIEQNKIQKT